MAILGKIRQRSIILIIVIAMALFAFVISGVITQPGTSLASIKPIAVVNNEDIEIDFFRQQVEQFQRTNPGFSTLQAVNYVYGDMTFKTLMEQQYDQLGIDIGPDQLEQLLRSNSQITNSPEFQNELGEFDFGKFRQYVSELKNINPMSYQIWNDQEQNLISVARLEIYSDLVKSSNVFSQSFAKLYHKLENDNVNIEYVLIPYDHIEDSLVQVTQQEIDKYYNENREDFKKDPFRSVHLAIFDNTPTDEDKEVIRVRLESLKEERISYNEVSKLTDTIPGFSDVTDIRDFIDRHSEIPFDSIYQAKGDLNNDYADLLFGLEKDEVFGPYEADNQYILSRVVDKKTNGNIRASHILIAYQGALRAEEDQLRSKEQAESLAKKLLIQARSNPDNFAQLAEENSDGPTASTGGDLGFFKEGEMADAFYQFCDRNRVGTIGMVETEFGFHVVNVVEKDDLIMLGNIVAEIIPSNQTSNETFRQATQFEMDVRQEPNRFEEIATENSFNYGDPNKINPMDEQLGVIEQTRDAVQWVFDKSTKVYDSQRFTYSEGYIVVQILSISDEGFLPLDEVSNQIEQIIEEDKRVDLIKQKYAAFESLEELQEQNSNFEINPASALNQRSTTIVGAGEESNVVGVAFALEENETSELIRGKEGMYKIKVLKLNPSEELEDFQSYAISLSNSKNNQIVEQVVDAIENDSKIKDNRTLYY